MDYSEQLASASDPRGVHQTYNSSSFADNQRQDHQEASSADAHVSYPRTEPTDTAVDLSASHGGSNTHPHSIINTNDSPQPTTQLLMSPNAGALRHDRIASHSYSGPGLLVAPLYQSMSPQHRASPMSPPLSRKRSRPSEFDLSVGGMADFGHTGLEGLGSGLDSTYTHSSMGGMHGGPGLTMTHHHHLPDMEPPMKMMRRDEGGSSVPSLVGQDGMPPPAPRPRGPKLKFTAEDDQLLIQLKEQKNLTWKQIADFFPGRSSGTLQVRYCTKLKAKTTLWTEEMVSIACTQGPDQSANRSHRIKSYEEHWQIMKTKSGESSHTRLALGSLRQHVASVLSSGSLANPTTIRARYHHRRCHQTEMIWGLRYMVTKVDIWCLTANSTMWSKKAHGRV